MVWPSKLQEVFQHFCYCILSYVQQVAFYGAGEKVKGNCVYAVAMYVYTYVRM